MRRRMMSWGIDQVWRQDGWILIRVFFLRVYGLRWSQGHKHAKKKEANIQPSWANEGFTVWNKNTMFLWDTAAIILSGQDSLMLPARVANQDAGFGLSCSQS